MVPISQRSRKPLPLSCKLDMEAHPSLPSLKLQLLTCFLILIELCEYYNTYT